MPALVPDLLWWRFRDGSGSTVTADVGPNGTITAGTWITGPHGVGALSFNGTSTRIDCSSSLTLGQVFTFACWFLLDTHATAGLLVWNGNPITNAGCRFATGLGGGTVEDAIQFNSAGQNTARSWGLLPTATWLHVALIFSQTANSNAGEISLYVDGVLQTPTASSSTKTSASSFQVYPLCVGCNPTAGGGAGGTFLPGDVADVRIYGRALSVPEINRIRRRVMAA